MGNIAGSPVIRPVHHPGLQKGVGAGAVPEPVRRAGHGSRLLAEVRRATCAPATTGTIGELQGLRAGRRQLHGQHVQPAGHLRVGRRRDRPEHDAFCATSMPAYTTLDAAIGVTKDNWNAEFYGENLTNSHASTFTSSAQFIKSEVPLRPRVADAEAGRQLLGRRIMLDHGRRAATSARRSPEPMDLPAVTAPSLDGAGSRAGCGPCRRTAGTRKRCAGAEALLADWPENRDLLLIARHQPAPPLAHRRGAGDAGSPGAPAPALQPAASGARPLPRRAARMRRGAIDALLRAVNINPALPMSWRMLEGLYRLTGDAAERRHRRRARRDAEGAAAGGGDRDLALLRRRSGAGRTDHPRLPAPPRRSSGGDAAAGQDRHGARRARRRRDAAGGRAGARARLSGRPLRLRRRAGPAAQIRPGARTRPGGCWRWSPTTRTTARWPPPSPSASATTRRDRASIASMLADCPGLRRMCNLWMGHALKTVGRVPEAIDAYRAAAAAPARLSATPIGAWPT